MRLGLTSLVEGNTLGKIDATVLAKPPNKNKDENKKPNPSFLNAFILNKPNKPVNVITGKIQSHGLVVKFLKGEVQLYAK